MTVEFPDHTAPIRQGDIFIVFLSGSRMMSK